MKKRKTYPKNQSLICASAKHHTLAQDVELHWHDCCEVELILSGQGNHIINGHMYPLNPGDLYFFTPADSHSMTLNEPVEILNIMFDEDLVQEELYTNILTLEMTGVDLLTRLSEKRRNLTEYYFTAILHELHAKSQVPLASVYVEHLLNCIIIELLRGITDITSASIDKQSMKEAILYLHHHYAEPITLTSLSKHLHLTPSYLSTYFKTNVGRSFKDYLIELRLRHACRLLVNTSLSVTDVCFNCGFSSYAHFMRTFRAHYNTSPLQFRRQHQPDVVGSQYGQKG